ncbi:MAG: hypothetical protein ACI4NM_00645 [Bullifex sp.]
MKDFDKLCKEFEQIDAETYADVLAMKSEAILPVLMAFSEDGLTGAEIFASFIYGAIAADGKLSEEEYALISPLLHAFLGDGVNYEDTAKAFRSMKADNKEMKKRVDEMVDLIGLFSEELKADIIIVIMLICAVDGKISMKEKAWIKQLIK